MQVAITGASGLIGAALGESLRADGHEVLRLVRGEPRSPGPDEVRWNPDAGYVDVERLEGVDVVVHLAGAGVGNRPWTSGYRKQIMDSRVKGTGTIAAALAQLKTPPRVLVSASATGYYGDAGDAVLDESAPAGNGFLADVVVAWEAAADRARETGIRVVHPRSGLVMTKRGGLLPKMILPYRVGLGGPIGSGRQWWSGISLHDEVAAMRHVVDHDEIGGPVNLVAPQAARNEAWTELIGRLLHRPTAVRVPALAIKLVDRAVSNQTSEMLLFGQHVRPAVLDSSGFQFSHPDPESILRWALEH